jgi:PAS domain-containing protein
LAALPGLRDLALTTNGVLLPKLAQPLRRAGLRRVNVHLDSLDPTRLARVMRWGTLEQIWAGLEAAEAAGFAPIKVNAVVVKGFNEDDVLPLAALTLDRPWHVRFVETMPFGGGETAVTARDGLVASAELRRRIEAVLGVLAPLEPHDVSDESRNYRVSGGRGVIGFISPVTEAYCGTCNRMRLTADGRFGGVVFVPLDYDNLRQFFLSLNVGQLGTVTLYRDDGWILLRTPNADEFAGRDVRSILIFTRYLPQAPSGSFKGSGLTDGISRSISYRRVAGMPLVVSVARDPVEFLAGWTNNALYYSVVAAGLNLLIAGFGLGLARQWWLREDSERALRDNLEQHQLVTENVPALIVHVGVDGHIRYANRVAIEWYGQPSTDAARTRTSGHEVSQSVFEETARPGHSRESQPGRAHVMRRGWAPA